MLWYVLEILGVYILFYLINRFASSFAKQIWLPLYFIFVLTAVILDSGTWWYISTSAFLIGIYFSDLKGLFCKLLSKRMLYSGIVLLTFVLYSAMQLIIITDFKLSIININYIITAMEMILTPLFLVSVAILVQILQFRSNRILDEIGKSSYNIYLYHMLFYYWIGNKIENTVLCVIAVSIITVCFSVFLRKVFAFLSDRTKV